MLFFAWIFSGPVLAAVLSLLSSAAAVYVALSAKEPEIFSQLPAYALFFVFCLFHFQAVQKNTRNKILVKEKLSEESELAEKEFLKFVSLKKATDEKINRFLSLQKFSEVLKEKKTLEAAAKEVVCEALASFPSAEECILYLVDPKKQDLYLVFGKRRDGGPLQDKEGTVFDRWVMKRSQAIVSDDVRNDFRFLAAQKEGRAAPRSLCASPLITENKVLGVVRVDAEKPGAFKADDLRLLDIFSSLGAVTLRNILLYEKMGELAIRDGLTGLYLNRYFQERLSEEIRRASLNAASFSLILFDIDFFKHYNDEYGHAAGDFVLKNAASIISRCIKPVDLAGRYGGEEFEVLLPNKGKNEALAVTENIRAEIEKGKILLRRVETGVTASFGVSTFPEDGRSKEELLWIADERMYHAKNTGRNRVCGSI